MINHPCELHLNIAVGHEVVLIPMQHLGCDMFENKNASGDYTLDLSPTQDAIVAIILKLTVAGLGVDRNYAKPPVNLVV